LRPRSRAWCRTATGGGHVDWFEGGTAWDDNGVANGGYDLRIIGWWQGDVELFGQG